jgi:hypothetical protein
LESGDVDLMGLRGSPRRDAMTDNSVVRARIDERIKTEAAVLETMD